MATLLVRDLQSFISQPGDRAQAQELLRRVRAFETFLVKMIDEDPHEGQGEECSVSYGVGTFHDPDVDELDSMRSMSLGGGDVSLVAE